MWTPPAYGLSSLINGLMSLYNLAVGVKNRPPGSRQKTMFRTGEKGPKVRAALKSISRAMDPFPKVRVSGLPISRTDAVSEGFSSFGRKFNKVLLREATGTLGIDRVRIIVQSSIDGGEPYVVVERLGSVRSKGLVSYSAAQKLGKQVNVEQGRIEKGPYRRQRASQSA